MVIGVYKNQGLKSNFEEIPNVFLSVDLLLKPINYQCTKILKLYHLLVHTFGLKRPVGR